MTTYITTPIYYVNAQPHLGHAYTTIVADTYSRFRRLCGDDVRFQTGTDEHGDKIVEAAQKEGKEPGEYVNYISGLFQKTWEDLKITPDYFIRTTDAAHIRVVQQILQRVYDSGDIYFDEYTGLYCKGCERFLTEKELVDGKCPDHLLPPQQISEQNYFFRMSKYQQQLLDHIGNNPEFITPERYRNEVLSFLSEPLEDLCISRPTSRLTWGIPLPFDADFVTYVWFDALINYLTGIGYPDAPGFAAYWDAAEHLIAKDILKPHAIYWPTMLMAIGLKPFRKLHVHGYWNVDDTKMSKSLGNVVRPAELVGEYGIDALRYFTLREMSFGLDSSFGHEAIVSRMNADLANDLGNLFSRSLAMLEKYCRCIVPEASASLEDSDRILIATAERMFDNYRVNMDSFQFHKALQAVWELVGQANKYVVVNEPWALAKDEAKVARLNTVLYNLAESLRILALVLSPVMPGTAAKMAACLGFGDDDPLVSQLEVAGRWGMYPPGKLVSLVASLFPRLDRKTAVAEKSIPEKKKNKTEKKESKMEQGLVTFDDFSRIEIQVAEILSARKVENSDRLLLLTVLAREQRTIVAGIAAFYNPEELIGRQVLVVANLTPAKIKGLRSEGMLLVAKTQEGDEERLVLATVGSPVKNGSRVA